MSAQMDVILPLKNLTMTKRYEKKGDSNIDKRNSQVLSDIPVSSKKQDKTADVENGKNYDKRNTKQVIVPSHFFRAFLH